MLSQVHRWRHSSLPPDDIQPQWLISLKAPKSHLNICHCCIFLKVVTATLVSSWYLPFHYSSTTRLFPFIKKSCEISSFPSFVLEQNTQGLLNVFFYTRTDYHRFLSTLLCLFCNQCRFLILGSK